MQLFEPAAVALESSRGYESPSSKMLLRHTALASDALIFLPAALASAAVFGGRRGSAGYLAVLVGLLFSPAAVLIDHGHFQYNCIGLGLAAGGAAAAAAGRDVLAALLFSLSLNHKQMGLYYAPAFFAYLLGKCLQRRTVAGKVRVGRQHAATSAGHCSFPAAMTALLFSKLWHCHCHCAGWRRAEAGAGSGGHLCGGVGALAALPALLAGRAAPHLPHPARPV